MVASRKEGAARETVERKLWHMKLTERLSLRSSGFPIHLPRTCPRSALPTTVRVFLLFFIRPYSRTLMP